MTNHISKLTWVAFGISLLITIGLCTTLLQYFYQNAFQYAQFHLEPQVEVAVLQIIIAGILCLAIYRVKKLHDIKLWYIIPAVLIIFAFLYLSTVTYCHTCMYGG